MKKYILRIIPAVASNSGNFGIMRLQYTFDKDHVLLRFLPYSAVHGAPVDLAEIGSRTIVNDETTTSRVIDIDYSAFDMSKFINPPGVYDVMRHDARRGLDSMCLLIAQVL